MRSPTTAIILGLVLCAWTPNDVHSGEPKADYPSPSSSSAPPKSAGLINDWLRSQSPAASAWDLGADIRSRCELKAHAGTFPNRDFIRQGQDNSTDYVLLRSQVHLGYTRQR